MIHITLDEKIQLDEFLVERSGTEGHPQWRSGKHPGTWIRFRWNTDEGMDMPYFLVAVEQRAEDIFEVGGMGIGQNWKSSGAWTEEEVLTHLHDVLCSATEYGTRIAMERYLQKLGIPAAEAHALNMLRLRNGDLELPLSPPTLVRTIFFEEPGWLQIRWKGGETVHITASLFNRASGGFGCFTGFIKNLGGDRVTWPEGFFKEKESQNARRERTSALYQSAREDNLVDGDQPEPEPVAGLPGLPEEVLLEVRGEPGHGPAGD